MSKQETGGPAYPRQTEWEPSRNEAEPDNTFISGNDGMSLLDYFAGQYLVGAGETLRQEKHPHEGAKEAYEWAAAMLAEKARREAESDTR